MSSFLVTIPIICPRVQEAHIDHVTRLGNTITDSRKHWSCKLNAIPTLSCCIPGFLFGHRFNGCGHYLHLVPLSAIDFVSVYGLPIHLLGVPPKDLNPIKIRPRNKVVDGWNRGSWQTVEYPSRPNRFMDGGIVQEESPLLPEHLRIEPSEKVLKVC